MTIPKCGICGGEFNDVSGRFLLDGSTYCWRCRLRDIHEGNHKDNETKEEKEFINNRWEILDL